MVLLGNAFWLSVFGSNEDASCTEDSIFAYEKNKFGLNHYCQYQKTPILQLVPGSLSFSHVEPLKIIFCLSFMNITKVAETLSSSRWIKNRPVLASLLVLMSHSKCSKLQIGVASPPNVAHRLGSLCAGSTSTLHFRNKCLQLSAVLFSRNICAA